MATTSRTMGPLMGGGNKPKLPKRPAAPRAPGQTRGLQTTVNKPASTKPSDRPTEQAKVSLRNYGVGTAPVNPIPKIPDIKPKGIQTGRVPRMRRPKTGLK